MDKKMTSGEIAKKAGVSQKAVRLYDEKGLLKPTEYSEGNYRLYDKEALEILEKIVALKKIGFSLEEIRDNLVAGDAVDIKEALLIQLKSMEEKHYQIEKVIDAINRTLERKSEDLDWDDVAEMVQSISLDQKSDEGHWDALQHTAGEEDWYVKIFKSLNIKENEKVLDLGCGFAKLWRNNWTDIPKGTKVFGYDIHGSWADDFAEFVSKEKGSLPEGVDISLVFENLEEKKAWESIRKEKDYSLIVAHYLDYELQNSEVVVAAASEVLSDDGVFSFNGPSVNEWHAYFKDVLSNLDIKSSFIDDIIETESEEREECVSMLREYFGTLESVKLTTVWHYQNSDEVIERMKKIYASQEKMILGNKNKIKEYFDKIIEADGEVAITINSEFWHCKK